METNQPPPAAEQELPDDFLADVSDENFVAAISAARTGKDSPGDTELTDSPLVDEKLIVGKAFWVWWPVGRRSSSSTATT